MTKIPKKAGVYLLINKVNGKMYVGQSINLMRRKAQYKQYETWPSSGEAAIELSGKKNNKSNILSCCKNRKNSKTALGYKWKYH